MSAMGRIAAAGAFVISLDSTVNIALPSMAADFAIAPERIRWVIVCYVLTYALISFAGGAAADRLGHARVFRAGVLVSAVAFALAALVPGFALFLGARVLQGIGGGLVYGTAPGLVTFAAAPARRGRALGLLNAAIGLGFTAGPLAAGSLVEAWGWRSVFLARVPVALAVLAWATLTAAPARAAVATRLVAGRDLIRPAVLGAGALSFLAHAGIFAVWLLAPFYLLAVRGLGPRAGGVLFTLTPLGTTLAAPLAGRLADRVGPRPPVVLGLVTEAAGLAALGWAGAETPVAVIGLSLLAAGFGLGLFQVPNMAVVMSAFPSGQQGAAGGVTFLARTLGVVTGVLSLAEVFARRRAIVGPGPAIADAFVLAAAAVALGAAIGALDRSLRRAP